MIRRALFHASVVALLVLRTDQRVRATPPLGVDERFTVHGLRRTFVDLARRARIDSAVTRSLTEYVTEKMRVHYSTVGIGALPLRQYRRSLALMVIGAVIARQTARRPDEVSPRVRAGEYRGKFGGAGEGT